MSNFVWLFKFCLIIFIVVEFEIVLVVFKVKVFFICLGCVMLKFCKIGGVLWVLSCFIRVFKFVVWVWFLVLVMFVCEIK